MDRLTSPIKGEKCRINSTMDKCSAPRWIYFITGKDKPEWNDLICRMCPFSKYINKLAEFEDIAEKFDDDLR